MAVNGYMASSEGRAEEGERVGLPMTRLKTWSLQGSNTKKGFTLHRRIFLSFLMELLSGLLHQNELSFCVHSLYRIDSSIYRMQQ